MFNASQVVGGIELQVDALGNPTESPWLIVRIDGKDHIVTNIKRGYDGIIGHNVVLETAPITTVL